MKKILSLSVLAIFLLFSTLCAQTWKSQYDAVGEFSAGMAIVKKGNKYGYVNAEGKLVIPVIYDYVGPFSEGLVIVSTNKKSGFADTRGTIVAELVYDKAGDFKNGFAAVQKDGKIGYINKEGQLVIPAQYDSYNNFSEGLVLVKQNGKFGFLNSKGQTVVPPTYEYGESFLEERALVYRDGKYGYIDKSGEEVIKPQYHGARAFSNGRAAVGSNGKAGFIDKIGKVIVPLEYDNVYSFDAGGLSLVLKDSLSWFINTSGDNVHGKKYVYANEYWGDKAFVLIDDKYLFVNRKGEPASGQRYDALIYKNEELRNFAVAKGREYLFLNQNGEDVSKYKYEEIIRFTTNGAFLRLKANGKYGLLTKKADFLLDIKYDTITYRNGGLFGPEDFPVQIWFKEGGKWGVTDFQKSFFTSPKYDENNTTLNRPMNRVVSNGFYGLIDSTGREVVEPVYEALDITFKSSGRTSDLRYFRVSKNKKWGYMKYPGELTVPLEYDRAAYFFNPNNNLAAVMRNNKWGFVDVTDGRLIVDCKYDAYDDGQEPKYLGSGAFVPLKRGELTGALDREGNVVVPFEYVIVQENWRDSKEIEARKYVDGKPYKFFYSLKGKLLRKEKM